MRNEVLLKKVSNSSLNATSISRTWKQANLSSKLKLIPKQFIIPAYVDVTPKHLNGKILSLWCRFPLYSLSMYSFAYLQLTFQYKTWFSFVLSPSYSRCLEKQSSLVTCGMLFADHFQAFAFTNSEGCL